MFIQTILPADSLAQLQIVFELSHLQANLPISGPPMTDTQTCTLALTAFENYDLTFSEQ